MVDVAKRVRRLLTIIIFEGESVTPVCLLHELHSQVALSRITIHTSEEAKVRIMNRMYCCPICTYMAKIKSIFLDHIIAGHYWSSFSCGKCLAFMAVTRQQMKRHLASCVKPESEGSKAHSAHSGVPEVHGRSRPSCRSVKTKKRTQREGVGTVTWKKPRSSPSQSVPVTTPLKQVSNTPDHGTHETTSISGQLGTSKGSKFDA